MASRRIHRSASIWRRHGRRVSACPLPPEAREPHDPRTGGWNVPHVALVGAGPGDPELLTVAAVRWLRRADVVFVDALVDARVVQLIGADARIIDVGKTGKRKPTPQDVIHTWMLAEARAGHAVVRLKGGDPFVFGRGGEEALFLRAHGFEVAIVPGISSALAVPGAAGVPVTHRGVATSFTVLTGTSGLDENSALEATWEAAARVGGTLVFLMAMHCLPRVVERVLAGGRAQDTPACVIQNGTRTDEVVLSSTLARVAEDVRAAGLGAPAVLVIGEVAGLRAALVGVRVEEPGRTDAE